MKPLWIQTLAWLAAAVVALLLALAVPEGPGVAPSGYDLDFSQGATSPR